MKSLHDTHRARRWALLAVAAALTAQTTVALAASPPAAAAGTRPSFELPFPCGERWQGATYDPHSPYNNNPLDFNQGGGSDDYGETVVASASGDAWVRKERDGDHVVVVDHGGGWTTEYRHMGTRSVTGGHVDRGDPVGTVGREGTDSPHLHFEQKLNGVPQPIYFHGRAAPYTYVYNGPTFTSYNCGTELPAERVGVDVVSRGLGGLDVFGRAGDGALVHRNWNGERWSDWVRLGGRLVSEPAVHATRDRIDVFGVGTDRGLWHKTWTRGSGWSKWRDLGGSLKYAPTVTSRGPGKLDVFAVGASGEVLHRFFNGRSWTGWVGLGAKATAAPGADAIGDDRINLAIRDADGTLSTRMWTRDHGWFSWVDRRVPVYGAPSVSHRNDRLVDVFTRDPADKSLRQMASTDGGAKFTAPVELGGVLKSAPAVTSMYDRRIDVFAIGANGSLYQRVWSAHHGWYRWTSHGPLP